MQFPTGSEVKDAVATFFSDVYVGGWGSTSQIVGLSGLRLGYSSSDYITALSKATIKISSSELLSKSTVDWIVEELGISNGTAAFTDADSVLDWIDIYGAVLDLREPGLAAINCSAGLTHMPFDLHVDFPIFAMDVSLNGALFGNARMMDLLIAPSSNSTTLAITLRVELRFEESDDIKSQVATVIEEMVVNGATVPGLMSATGLVVGVSLDDNVNAFSAMVGELDMTHITGRGTTVLDSLVSSLQLDDVLLGIAGEQELTADVVATMNKALPNIYAHIPYLHLEVELNGVVFAQISVVNVEYSDGAVVANASVFWPTEVATIQRVGDVITNILFNRTNDLSNDVVRFVNLQFGASESDALLFASDAGIVFNAASYIAAQTALYAEGTSRHFELIDIHTVLTDTGVSVNITGSVLPSTVPFRNKENAGAIVQVMYAPNGTVANDMFDVLFHDLYFVPNEHFTFNLDVVARDFVPSIASILPRLIEFRPYLADVWVGRVILTDNDPRQGDYVGLQTFGQLNVVCPDEYFYSPLYIRPSLKVSLTEGLDLDIDMYFSNPGPLHLELGSMGVILRDRTEEIGNVTLTINTLNNLEGGNAQYGNHVPISVKITLDPLLIGQNLVDLITGAKQYSLDWFSFKEGVGADNSAPWLVDLLDAAPADLVSNLIPVIVAVLGNIDIQIGDWDINLSSVFKSTASEILQWGEDHYL
ncbi:hypothetical protein HK405_011394, partial [Cladochytrium tenue]